MNVLGCGDRNTHRTLSSNEINIAQLKLPEAGRWSGSQVHETPCRSMLAWRHRAWRSKSAYVNMRPGFGFEDISTEDIGARGRREGEENRRVDQKRYKSVALSGRRLSTSRVLVQKSGESQLFGWTVEYRQTTLVALTRPPGEFIPKTNSKCDILQHYISTTIAFMRFFLKDGYSLCYPKSTPGVYFDFIGGWVKDIYLKIQRLNHGVFYGNVVETPIKLH